MWQNYFTAVIAIGIIIRLVFIMTGPMTAEDKIGKAGNWLIGLLLVGFSWLMLNYVFGGSAGSLFKGDGTPINKSNSPYFNVNKKTSSETDTITIKINTKERE